MNTVKILFAAVAIIFVLSPIQSYAGGGGVVLVERTDLGSPSSTTPA